MSEVFDDVSDDYVEISEPEHFDQVLQGTLDTLVGNEANPLSFTSAQRYLYSCLESSDSLSRQARVGGMEGVFGAIGDGLKAAWEYVMKLFKTVWNYFFGSGEATVEAKVEKAEKKIEKNKEALEAVAKTGKSEKQVEGIRKKVKAKANKIVNDPKASSSDKAVAKDIVKKIDEGNVKSTSQKEMDIGEMTKKLAKIDKAARENIIKQTGSAEALRKKYHEYVTKDRSAEITDGSFKSMYKVFRETLSQGTFNTTVPELVKVDSITDVLSASITQDKLKKAVEDHGKFAKFITSEKAEFQSEIKAIETEISKSDKGKDKKALEKRLKSANAALSIVNATAGFQTKMLAALEKLSDSVVAVFGDYTDVVVVI